MNLPRSPRACSNSTPFRLPGLALATLALTLLGLGACDSTLPHQVQAGGSFVSAFDPGADVIGFGSTFGGPDAQRGDVSFVLCPSDQRGCEPGTPLEAQFMTRVSPDRFSLAGLRGRVVEPTLGIAMPIPGATVALLRVPRLDEGGPTPGRYRVEARVRTPQGTSDVLRGDGPAVEVLEGVGEPLALPGASNSLPQLVPLPRITLTVARRSASSGTSATAVNRTSSSPVQGPAAAELIVRFPDSKVALRGAAEVGTLGTQSLLSMMPGPTPDTVRISMLAPRGDTRQIGLAFEATASDSAPVAASEFEIVEQVLYDERGAVDDSVQFELEPVIR